MHVLNMHESLPVAAHCTNLAAYGLRILAFLLRNMDSVHTVIDVNCFSIPLNELHHNINNHNPVFYCPTQLAAMLCCSLESQAAESE